MSLATQPQQQRTPLTKDDVYDKSKQHFERPLVILHARQHSPPLNHNKCQLQQSSIMDLVRKHQRNLYRKQCRRRRKVHTTCRHNEPCDFNCPVFRSHLASRNQISTKNCTISEEKIDEPNNFNGASSFDFLFLVYCFGIQKHRIQLVFCIIQ